MIRNQPFPLFFSFYKDVVIFYIGANHSRNYEDPQFSFIKEKWNEFLINAKKPCIVVEGHITKRYKDEIEAVTEGGEIAFMTFIATVAGIPVFCFEPPRSKEMNWLAKQFSKEEIAYYYFARVIAQWYRQGQKKNLEEYVLPFLERDRKASGWHNFKFSINHMQDIHRSLFGNVLNFSDVDFFRTIENPTLEKNPLKNIVRASGKYRDTFIINSIKKLIKKRYDIFIVYGRGHIETHHKKLEEYLK